jgi:hypothetical protein
MFTGRYLTDAKLGRYFSPEVLADAAPVSVLVSFATVREGGVRNPV